MRQRELWFVVLTYVEERQEALPWWHREDISSPEAEMAFRSAGSSWEAPSFCWAHQGEEERDCGAPVPLKCRLPLPAARITPGL